MSNLHRHTACRRRAAFTLVELLVVIGIIGVLVSILIPAVGKARRQAKALREMSDIRQVTLCYLQYTTDSRGWLLPGHVVGNWVLKDSQGRNISGETSGRWPWRLMASSRYTVTKALYIDERAEILLNGNAAADPMWAYAASLVPSFGLNMYNLGGDLRDPNSASPGMARKINQVAQSTRMIAFASARSLADPDGLEGTRSGDGGPNAHGYWLIQPPIRQTRNPGSGAWQIQSQWSPARYNGNGDVTDWGHLHPRCDGKVAVSFIDGHCELLTIDDLRDMRLWNNAAARAGDANYVAP